MATKSVGGYQIVDLKGTVIPATQAGVTIPGLFDTIARCIENQKPVLITNIVVGTTNRRYPACSPCMVMRTTASSTIIEFSILTGGSAGEIDTFILKSDSNIRYSTFRPAEYSAAGTTSAKSEEA